MFWRLVQAMLLASIVTRSFAATCQIEHVLHYNVGAINEYTLDFLPEGQHRFSIRTKDTSGQYSEATNVAKNVTDNAPNTVLRWTTPTTRVDGGPLPYEEIAGYEITHVLPFTTEVACENPGETTTIDDLLAGYISQWSQEDLDGLGQQARNPPEEPPGSDPSETLEENELPTQEIAGLTGFLTDQQDTLDQLVVDQNTNPPSQQPAPEAVITTPEVIAATTSAMSCFNWEVKGVCIWMTCVGPVCTFDFSIKVKNFVPDLLVQAYDHGDAEPWEESKMINTAVQGTADSSWVTTIISWIESFDVSTVGIQGGVTTETRKDHHANLNYKFVDAYGNPALSAFTTLASSTGLFCDGNTEMLYPYFISNLDSIAWRWDIPEMFYPQSWVPMATEWDLGDETNNYGPIYPRHGFMTAQDPLKAGVLSAFRAAHVITRETEPHFYVSIFEPRVDGDWSPEPLEKDDEDTGVWQMLYPKKETGCQLFPYEAEPPEDKRSEDGSYVWNFWRAYECCERKGAVLVYHDE